MWRERLDTLKMQLFWPFRRHFDNYDDVLMVLTKIFNHWAEVQNMPLHDQVVNLLERMKYECPAEIFCYLDYTDMEIILDKYAIIDGRIYAKLRWP
jgi:hypothetical protein